MRKLVAAACVPLGTVLALAGVATTGQAQAGRPAAPAAATEIPASLRPLLDTAGIRCTGITAAVLAAQLYVESRFNPNAASPAGAEGIAQFMPSTWSVWGQDANGDGHADPFDPADAIDAQARYMCALLTEAAVSRFPGGNLALALAAYNAGWAAIQAHRGVPPDPPTENYVREVLDLAVRYGATSPAPDPRAAVAVAYAYTQLGTPYLWGGDGPGGFDCSGLTMRAWAAAGVSLPRTSQEQWFAGASVGRDQLAPGDLVFFAYDLTNPATIHHVGIYIGDGRIIHAPHTGAVVTIATFADQPGYLGARRP